jgi:type I restriction enzyme S subunit
VIIEQDLVYVDHEVLTLPDGWRMTTLEDLIAQEGWFCDGDWVESKDQDPNGDVRLIQLADIGIGSYRDRSDRYLTSERASALSCSFLKRGDILIARMPDPLGRACIFPGDKRRAVTVVDVAIVRPNNPEVSNRWLMHRINSLAFRNAVASLQSGSTRLRISRKNLARIAFLLPPLIQQLSALEEIETQFSRLDEAVANLQRVKANLKRYKASVLKAAVEGRLVETEASIAQREGRSYETGEQLLQRILEVRRGQWHKKTGYKEPSQPALSQQSELPEGWKWACVEQLNPGDRPCAYGVLQPGDNLGNGIPFVRVGDINDGLIDFADMKSIQPDIAAAYPRTKLKGGEVLLTLVGAIGRTAVVPSKLTGANVARAVGVLPVNELIDPHWVEMWFRNPAKIAEMTAKSHEVARKTLNLEDVRFAAVALPPKIEQIRIVAEVDRYLSIIRGVEAEVDANLKRAQALRQATLKSCFQSKGSCRDFS